MRVGENEYLGWYVGCECEFIELIDLVWWYDDVDFVIGFICDLVRF